MMFAIVEFMGYQYRIEKNATIKVPFIAEAEAGKEIKLDRVLLVQDEAEVTFGHPILETAHATAEVLRNGREKKVVVFKKKRRKGFRKTQGHRQDFTEIKIKDINF
jgi:large subunit ribosomal protein L21